MLETARLLEENRHCFPERLVGGLVQEAWNFQGAGNFRQHTILGPTAAVWYLRLRNPA